ncbi:NACHT, LRR and PYD domains-containing protein 3-like isoform X2 [Pygocentrus nattereri]|uniref:NACHT, LRR and PYD domains-containing protein 3-like isoform X2 n=1 Tax=Pygocentrus nattereri TaxID=42514 RepID=UPI0018916C48|nr:NACHT, LRR and PYD domains-containing protein 3-like isoform X2 [Pygocentrus nattereri]
MEKADGRDTEGRMVESYGRNGAVEMMKQKELTEEPRSDLRGDGAERTVPVTSDRVETARDQTSLQQTISAQNSTVCSINFTGTNFASTPTINVCIGAGSSQKDAQRRAENQYLKSKIKEKYATLYEGTAAKGKHNLLNDIYTELYIVEDWTGGVNTDHEVIQIEARPARHAATDAAIKFSEVFSGSKHVKKVLTLGIAGIGKTVSVQKFAVDWAEGKSNADIDFVFIIPFRELNLLKDKEYSLPELLHHVYPEQQPLNETGLFDGECKCVFIFDGLDEFRSPLSFDQKKISAVTEKASVNVLVTSLITGTLFPSARVWITSRPAAADQIPSKHIHLVTEVQGFVTDQQKEEYFRKRIGDQDADEMILLIKKSKTLYIMCYIPVFCWITYTVLQHIMKNRNTKELKSLTQMYAHFLTIQMETKREKDNKTPQKDTKNLLQSNKTILLKLAELAFKQLMKGNVMFYEEDLRESSIDVTEASVYSGIFTGFFKEETPFQQRKVYSFVHLSFQEFLAAVYVFHCYQNKKMEELEMFKHQSRKRSENDSLDEVLKGAVIKAVKSQNGHLDLFLRFLLGISLESNQRCLQGLLTPTQFSTEETRRYIPALIEGDAWTQFDFEKEKYPISTERFINLFLCLSEMNDQSVSRKLQEYLNSEGHSRWYYSLEHLSLGLCSALVYMLLNSGEVLDELDLKKYITSEEGYRRLIPALTVCRKALLVGCNLTKDSCETLCSALQSANSPLKELDLSNNNLQDSGVKLLSAGLKSSQCTLEKLRLVTCNIGQKVCENLGSALQSANSSLKELDLSNNDLQDSGVELLSAGLKSSHCKLEKLGLSDCMVTVKGCSHLASALKSNPSHLKELDLRYNHPGESGVKMLSELKEDRHCALEILRVDHGGEIWMEPGVKKYAVRLTLDPNTVSRNLSLSEGNRKAMRVWNDKRFPFHRYQNYPDYPDYPDHPDRFGFCAQVLSVESLTGRCYWEVEWSGMSVDIAVSYRGIERKGGSCCNAIYSIGTGSYASIGGNECQFGRSNQSWCLTCCNDGHRPSTVCHNNQFTVLSARPSPSDRVGVYLDWDSGTLSFYTVSPDTHTLTRLYTFTTTFTEPLYAGIGVEGAYSGFGFDYKGASVRLCDIIIS